MLDIDIAADTDLGQRALHAAERYVTDNVPPSLSKEEDWPIARAQIKGLRQIATNEPAKVREFAEHQRAKVDAKLATVQKDERRQELAAKIAFWELVIGLCEGKPPKFDWSLMQACSQTQPAELTDEKNPPDARPTREQQAARKEKKERRDRWEQQWKRDHYPAFFDRFCAHYLYAMAKRTQGE
jgi:hypothetical protein